MKNIYLIFLLFGSLFSEDVFYDAKTDLTWQDNKEAVEKVYELKSGIFSTGAIDYCSKLELNGFTDWRLPTIREYINILDISKYNPAIRVKFKYIILKDNYDGDYYWTSTLRDDQYTYVINIKSGSFSGSWNKKEYHYFVRCVRKGDD